MPRRRRRPVASRHALLGPRLPALDPVAVAAMEKFLQGEYNARRTPSTAAPVLVLIVALHRDANFSHEPFPIRARVVDHLGLDSPFGIDCAIRKALERGLITEQVDILERDNPDRPQDKHMIARRRYIPSDVLCMVVDDARIQPRPVRANNRPSRGLVAA